MSSIRLLDDEVDFARRLGIKRSGSMNHADTRNSQNFFDDRAPWWRHFIGALGEVAYGKFSSQSVDVDTIGRGDDGTDFSGGVQVKCAYQKNRPRLMMPVSQYSRKHCDKYVMTWVKTGQMSRVYLVGEISADEFDRVKQKVTDWLPVPTFVCPPSMLSPVLLAEQVSFLPRKPSPGRVTKTTDPRKDKPQWFCQRCCKHIMTCECWKQGLRPLEKVV